MEIWNQCRHDLLLANGSKKRWKQFCRTKQNWSKEMSANKLIKFDPWVGPWFGPLSSGVAWMACVFTATWRCDVIGLCAFGASTLERCWRCSQTRRQGTQRKHRKEAKIKRDHNEFTKRPLSNTLITGIFQWKLSNVTEEQYIILMQW